MDRPREYAPLHTVCSSNDRVWAEELPHSLTFAVMTVDNGQFQVEKVVIPHEKK